MASKPKHAFNAKRLRELREAAGWSMYALAKTSTVPQQYISALEHGEKDNPSLRVVSMLAAALGVSIVELCA